MEIITRRCPSAAEHSSSNDWSIDQQLINHSSKSLSLVSNNKLQLVALLQTISTGRENFMPWLKQR
jgi:hypothetical protein